MCRCPAGCKCLVLRTAHPRQGDARAVQIPGSHPSIVRLREFIRDAAHPCVMAKSVLAHEAIGSGIYRGLGCRSAAQAMCVELYRSLAARHDGFWSFAALFPTDRVAGEEEFESRLWTHLQRMHDFDAPLHRWDSAVSPDAADPRFSFSIGGRAWYVIGLHPDASRKARRFDHVALVFNPHAQFDDLRRRGRYAAMRSRIRQRDQQLQGSINPMLADHGESSEARQYSGRAVEASWQCPFVAQGTPARGARAGRPHPRTESRLYR